MDSAPTNVELTEPQPAPVIPPSSNNVLTAGGVTMIVVAAFLLLCGTCSTFFYLILPVSASNSRGDISSSVLFGSSAGVGILFGAVLAWQGINILRGRESRTSSRMFPPFLILVAAFLAALLIGMGTQAIKPYDAYLFPPWHFIAAILPPLAFLAYAARRLGGTSGFRALVTSFSWGAFGAAPIAVVVEIVGAVALIVAAAIVIALLPDGNTILAQLQTMLPRLRGTLDTATAMNLLTNPGVLIGALIYFSIIIPIVEESLKTLVVGFIDPKRTQLKDAVLWGISAGAGFAAIESIYNGGAGLSLWVVAMLTRVGATTMHVANGVTMGRGWYAARVERRWGKLFIAYLVSIFFHGLWNALAISISGAALVLSSNTSVGLNTAVPASVIVIALVTGLIILASLSLAWIVYSIQSVREPGLEKISMEGEVTA